MISNTADMPTNQMLIRISITTLGILYSNNSPYAIPINSMDLGINC